MEEGLGERRRHSQHVGGAEAGKAHTARQVVQVLGAEGAGGAAAAAGRLELVVLVLVLMLVLVAQPAGQHQQQRVLRGHLRQQGRLQGSYTLRVWGLTSG